MALRELCPDGVQRLEFDALLLAEGEWSATCKRLGITKSIDRFSTAIGLVINMVIDPAEPKTKDPNMRSFTINPIEPMGKALKAAKIDFEFGEYLKGETQYTPSSPPLVPPAPTRSRPPWKPPPMASIAHA